MPGMVSAFARFRIATLALAATALALTGCQSGPSGGEGPGIKEIANGELNGNVTGTLDATVDAVLQTLVQMGVLNAQQRREAAVAEIHAQTLEEIPLDIKLSRVAENVTKLRIQAGSGNEELARTIFGRVRNRLEFD